MPTLIYQFIDAGLILSVPYVMFRVALAVRNAWRQGQALTCPACQHTARVVVRRPGHWAVEAMLWLLGITPGLVYSVWRLSAQKHACGHCGTTFTKPVQERRPGLATVARGAR